MVENVGIVDDLWCAWLRNLDELCNSGPLPRLFQRHLQSGLIFALRVDVFAAAAAANAQVHVGCLVQLDFAPEGPSADEDGHHKLFESKAKREMPDEELKERVRIQITQDTRPTELKTEASSTDILLLSLP